MERIELTTRPTVLFDRRRTAHDYLVLGVALGDPVESLPTTKDVDPEPYVPDCAMQYGQGTRAIRRAGSTDFVPYELAERLDDLRRYGGRLRAPIPGGGVVVFTVKDGRVTEATLRDGWVETLLLRDRAQVLVVLGDTERWERSYGRTTWAWVEREIMATWGDEQGALDSVVLGLDRAPPVFDARDLVQAAVRWRSAYGTSWPLQPHPGSRSSQVEAERLHALMRAWNLLTPASPLSSFFEGGFLSSRSGADSVAALRLVRELFPELRFQPGERQTDLTGVQWFWRALFASRLELEAVAEANSGVLEAGSALFRTAVEIRGVFAARAKTDCDRLDLVLARLIDPEGRAFTWGRLVRAFGFPDEDLQALSAEDY